ncbi:hypothetical protein C1646_712474 [Rhizophagus diaphanus]|nr:hypothetical protein C1646_712474 [Rhizophagus diaphanus] [Rhizophagus sp. MUCL 43196]
MRPSSRSLIFKMRILMRPNPFHTNVLSLCGLPGQNLDTLLAFYGLQVTGGLDARQ